MFFWTVNRGNQFTDASQSFQTTLLLPTTTDMLPLTYSTAYTHFGLVGECSRLLAVHVVFVLFVFLSERGCVFLDLSINLLSRRYLHFNNIESLEPESFAHLPKLERL